LNFNFSHRNSLNLALIVCWLATAVIGFHGFFRSHDLLTFSLFESQLPDVVSTFLAILVFGLPILGLFINVRIAKWLLLLAVLIYIVLIFFDLHRLTPFMIVYFGIFTALILLKYDSSILYTALLIIASGIYIFSGLHKLNLGFVTDIAPRLWFYSLPLKYTPTIGYGFAVIEILSGLLLLVPLSRKLACIIIIAMHLLIIWKLGPWKMNWNLIVMPWNLMMICLLVYLYRKSALSKFRIGSAKPIVALLGIFFWLLPGLSQAVWIPENLSMKLYSGKSVSGYLVVLTKVDRFKKYDRIPEEKQMIISLQRLSMEERGIAFNPEQLIYDRALQKIKDKIPETDNIYYIHPNDILENLETP
jgi:hypothetical protein